MRSISPRSARSSSARMKSLKSASTWAPRAWKITSRRPPGGEGEVRAAPAQYQRRRARRSSRKSIARRSSFRPNFQTGETVRGFVGLDGGSTSTKAVLLSEAGDMMCKAYQLSGGNPIQDTIDMFEHAAAAGGVAGSEAGSARRRHHRLREGRSQGRAKGGRGAGGNRRAHRVGDEVL